jgi:hypothetical protein
VGYLAPKIGRIPRPSIVLSQPHPEPVLSEPHIDPVHINDRGLVHVKNWYPLTTVLPQIGRMDAFAQDSAEGIASNCGRAQW